MLLAMLTAHLLPIPLLLLPAVAVETTVIPALLGVQVLVLVLMLGGTLRVVCVPLGTRTASATTEPRTAVEALALRALARLALWLTLTLSLLLPATSTSDTTDVLAGGVLVWCIGRRAAPWPTRVRVGTARATGTLSAKTHEALYTALSTAIQRLAVFSCAALAEAEGVLRGVLRVVLGVVVVVP